ncbi:MAG: pyrroline-5-carboxylate reductase [Oscillospiraceae bacterium]
MKKIGFIGAGNMATAIIGGMAKSNTSDQIFAYDLDELKLENLKQYGVVSKSTANLLVLESEYLFLAIKPQNFPEVLAEIKLDIKPETVIVSIAAGVTGEYISRELGYDAKVIQVMPNTPLLLGVGATALSKMDNVSDEEFAVVKNIFDCAGITAVVPRNKMNEVIAINGSSPAFIYEFARCFIEYGKSVGLEEKVCLDLFAQSLIGSAKMMTQSGNSIDDLIKMVSSKGGTTIAGLDGLKENNLQNAVNCACQKCTKRAYELTK